MRRRAFLAASAGTLALAGCGADARSSKAAVEVYRRASCGCCGAWVEHLRAHGYRPRMREVADLDAIKRRHAVPRPLESCHTAVVAGYVVEGHVPADVVDALLRERPGIDGIALPGMPPGSPGMPGAKQGPWTVYAFRDGRYEPYRTV